MLKSSGCLPLNRNDALRKSFIASPRFRERPILLVAAETAATMNHRMRRPRPRADCVGLFAELLHFEDVERSEPIASKPSHSSAQLSDCVSLKTHVFTAFLRPRFR